MLGALFLLLTGSASVELDVVYSKVAGEELKMDIYSPSSPANGQKRGAVAVFHGGAWMFGNRQSMAELCKTLAESGLVAATVQYRLAPKHKWPAMLDDAQTAVRYLRKNAERLGIDPERIGASGASAGGHLSLLLGFRDTVNAAPSEHMGVSSRVRAVLNLFGPTDLSNTKDYPASLDMMFATVLGKARAQATEEIKSASPVYFVDAKSAPVFTIQGKIDGLVPVAQAEALDAKLKASGVPHLMNLIENMGHELPLGRPEVVEALKKGIEWMKAQLTPSSTLELPGVPALSLVH
jgi:acetyl esterase/lipase